MSSHTPAPWVWSVNPKHHGVELSHGTCGDSVMRFCRWGMGGATPLFRRDGRMVRAVDLSVIEPGREHHAAWWRLIDHPDARLIQSAPELFDALAAVERLFSYSDTMQQFVVPWNARTMPVLGEARRLLAKLGGMPGLEGPPR